MNIFGRSSEKKNEVPYNETYGGGTYNDALVSTFANTQTDSISTSISLNDCEIMPLHTMDADEREELIDQLNRSLNHPGSEYLLVKLKRPVLPTPPPFKFNSQKAVQNENNAVHLTASSEVEIETQPAQSSISEEPISKETVATTMDADEIQYLNENATLLLQAGEVNLARNIYRAILKTGEASDVAYAGLAECADVEGLIEQAIQFAWDSVAFSPNKRGYQILTQLLVQQGRDQEAASALTRALKSLQLTTNEKGEYYKTIGNCYSRLGQNEDAEGAYKKALELCPSSDEVQSNLGSLYLEDGKIQDAKRCYQDALAGNPLNDKAWVGLGLCFVTEGSKEQAHDAFARSLERNLRNSTAVFHLVKCAYEIKKYSVAESVLSQYVEVAPVSPSLLYSLAGLQFHVGKKREAILIAKRILQMKADHAGARDLISRIEAEQV